MGTSDALNTMIDPDLDSQFSHMTMAPSQVDPNIDPSAPWPDQNTTFPPDTGAGDLNSHYLHDNTLAPPTSAQQVSSEFYQYIDSTSYQLYQPPDDGSVQAGPSSSLSNAATADYPFMCDEDGCNRGFKRQCDLEYVSRLPHSPFARHKKQ
jgi:hypothetical protein